MQIILKIPSVNRIKHPKKNPIQRNQNHRFINEEFEAQIYEKIAKGAIKRMLELSNVNEHPLNKQELVPRM